VSRGREGRDGRGGREGRVVRGMEREQGVWEWRGGMDELEGRERG